MQYQEINPRSGNFMPFDLLDTSPEAMVPELSLILSFGEFEALTDAWMTAKQLVNDEIVDPALSDEQYQQAQQDDVNMGLYPFDTLSMLDDYKQYKIDHPDYAQLVDKRVGK